MTLSNLIRENQHKALSLKLSDYPGINDVLQHQKDKLRDAELESERNEVKAFAENAIKELKHRLQLYLRNNYGKAKYVNHAAPYLWDIRLLLEYRELLEPQQTETRTEQEQQTENDFTLSTIEDWLFEFKEKMNEADYKNLVSALIQYFERGKFPTLSKPIQINGRPNKKLFGWALNRIFEAKGKGVEKELLQFAKHNISLFTDVQFDESNILKSNLYKYFTTQTK